MWRRLLSRLALAGLLLACGRALVLELGALARKPPATSPPPLLWDLRSPPIQHLRPFLEEVDSLLPPRSRIAVGLPPEIAGQEFFAFAWIGYFLPRHHVDRAIQPRSTDWAEYLVTYDLPWPDPRWEAVLGRPLEQAFTGEPELLLERPPGRLYHLVRR